jgi:soluble lytic murein transglycosylase-like protein
MNVLKQKLIAVAIAVVCLFLVFVVAFAASRNVKAKEATQPLAEVKTETLYVEVPVLVQAETAYFRVALPDETQDIIFRECEKYGIPPSVIVAMIARESRFDEKAIGDNGESLGLMQIKKKYHGERMAALGCDDLLDGVQNVTVGINYLAELMVKYGDMAKALVAYNRGSYGGTVTGYAVDVLEMAVLLEWKREL